MWSEKGTIRGVLAPVLNQYAVGFRVMHGFSSATSVHDVAGDDDGRDLIALYVGDGAVCCGDNGLRCLPVANGTTGAQRFWPHCLTVPFASNALR